jgi:Fe2+ transport system protein FeoA
MTLRDIKEGDYARIIHIRGSGPFRRRLMEMGFVPGETVFVQRYAPLRDPVEFIIMGYHVSLRRADASMIEVISPLSDHKPSVLAEPPRRRGWRNRWRRG